MPGSASIVSVFARQVLDSRGRPTVEADVQIADGSIGRAIVPSGASRGRYEACELRDGYADDYEGMSVSRAVGHVRGEIAGALLGQDVREQAQLDRILAELDGSASFNRLGANAVLAVSLAASRAAAQHSGLGLHRYLAALAGTPLSMPMPMTNILSGGAHAGRGMDLQDFLAIPVGAQSYGEALAMISRVRSGAARLMADQGLTTLLADEGGLSPGCAAAQEGLELMVRAFDAAGLRPGEDMAIALDVAASELYHDGAYDLQREGQKLNSAQMIDFIVGLASRYPVVSIEDALEQDDWPNWEIVTKRLSDIQIIGDDLLVTSVKRIRQAVQSGCANAVLIKVNQNGTLTGTLEAMRTAREAGYATVVSARSGESEDSFIADLAVGTGAGQIKIGSVRNSERLAKYNQLLRISEEPDIEFAGMSGVAGRSFRPVAMRTPV